MEDSKIVALYWQKDDNAIKETILTYSANCFTIADNILGGFERCPYYTNPDVSEWVYVYQKVTTAGTADEHGTLNSTAPHGAYAWYADVRLRGKDLICYNGE